MAECGNLAETPDASKASQRIIDVSTSAGGARANAVIALNRETREIRSGQFDAPAGFEHWLPKFDGMGEGKELGPSHVYGRIEYAYYLMATAAGLGCFSNALNIELLVRWGPWIVCRHDFDSRLGRNQCLYRRRVLPLSDLMELLRRRGGNAAAFQFQ